MYGPLPDWPVTLKALHTSLENKTWEPTLVKEGDSFGIQLDPPSGVPSIMLFSVLAEYELEYLEVLQLAAVEYSEELLQLKYRYEQTVVSEAMTQSFLADLLRMEHERASAGKKSLADALCYAVWEKIQEKLGAQEHQT